MEPIMEAEHLHRDYICGLGGGAHGRVERHLLFLRRRHQP